MYKPLGEKFLVVHGHQLDFWNNEAWRINEFLVRYIWKFLNGIAGFKDPTRSAKSKTQRSRIDIKLQDWARDNCTMLLCGHTHNTRFPGLYEPPYFNDGCCVGGRCRTDCRAKSCPGIHPFINDSAQIKTDETTRHDGACGFVCFLFQKFLEEESIFCAYLHQFGSSSRSFTTCLVS